jgi:hypothetical protein
MIRGLIGTGHIRLLPWAFSGEIGIVTTIIIITILATTEIGMVIRGMAMVRPAMEIVLGMAIAPELARHLAGIPALPTHLECRLQEEVHPRA